MRATFEGPVATGCLGIFKHSRVTWGFGTTNSSLHRRCIPQVAYLPLLLLLPVARLLLFLFPLSVSTFTKESIGKYNASRTIEYILHFFVDAVSDLQQLCGCHTNFLLCQLVQSLERILDICLSHQLLQILFLLTISGTDTNARVWKAHLCVPALSPLSQ
jgi:hypothetical protein